MRRRHYENLHPFESEQAHQVAHGSIERLMPELLASGFVEFDGRGYKFTEKWQALGVAVTALSQMKATV